MNSSRLAVFVFVSKFKTRTLCALKLLAWAIWMLFSLSLNLLKPRWFFQNPLTSTARIPTGLALLLFLFFSGVYLQFSHSVVFDSATPWIAARQTSLSITNSQSLPKLMSIESVMPSSHLILCHSLLLPSIFPSVRVFSNESALHIRWPKYWTIICI